LIQVKDMMVRDVAHVAVPGNRAEVLKVLQKRQVSGVPVIKAGEVVGMITRSDLLRNPEEDQTALIMTRTPATITPESTMVDAAKAILQHGVRRLPVIEGRKLIGIVSIADVVKVAAGIGIEVKISNYMERNAVALWADTPLPVAGAIMELAQAEACPVLGSDLRLAGIISDRDLINASAITDSTAKTSLESAAEDDDYQWDRFRQPDNFYYGVSKIELKNVLVKDAMVPAMTTRRDNTVSESAEVMRKNRIDQLPVTTPGQKLVGMFRDRDVAKALVDYYSQGQNG
jgi:CBS domain-containing protein